MEVVVEKKMTGQDRAKKFIKKISEQEESDHYRLGLMGRRR
jgi:hypothetical protein